MVKLRRARNGRAWEYSIIFRWPDGSTFRERRDAPVAAKSAAQRWAEAREASLLAAGKDAWKAGKTIEPATTTLGDFWPRVVRDHYEANRKKPSTIDAAKTIYRVHLAEALGAKALRSIGNADVAALKSVLTSRSRKTANNVLSVLSVVLQCAVEWEVIPAVPCKIKLLPTTKVEMEWYERDVYRRLVDAAAKLGTGHLVLVLLAGSAGLRRGEIIALKWSDVDLKRKILKIDRAFWRQHEETPKGGRGRPVPMTDELAEALNKHRHLRGDRVLYSENGHKLSNRVVRNWLGSVLRRAGVPVKEREYREPKNAFEGKPCKICSGTLRRPVKRLGKLTSLCVGCERRRRAEGDGPIHILRHTFCSHLAAAGVPAKTIQELAGHADLATTLRYMHLAPSDRSAAMGALTAYHSGESEPSQRRDTSVA